MIAMGNDQIDAMEVLFGTRATIWPPSQTNVLNIK